MRPRLGKRISHARGIVERGATLIVSSRTDCCAPTSPRGRSARREGHALQNGHQTLAGLVTEPLSASSEFCTSLMSPCPERRPPFAASVTQATTVNRRGHKGGFTPKYHTTGAIGRGPLNVDFVEEPCLKASAMFVSERRLPAKQNGTSSPHRAKAGSRKGMSFASFRRFWAVAANRNSSFAPLGPRRRNRPSLRMRLR